MKHALIALSIVIAVCFSACAVSYAQTETAVPRPGYERLPDMDKMIVDFGKTTGLFGFIFPSTKSWTDGIGKLLMICVGVLLLYLAIKKGFEPLLLVPMGVGAVLANIPSAGITEPGGILFYIYEIGIKSGVFPLFIFMGIGAMTDFGPMIANPKTALLGAAAQFGI
ncbi:MAG: sodium ion-translocating decarboxylase subunit beta, partial [Desulfatirhabdiaceae bacterium]|nr:sodium ion-translocating decarboxylase subunit beta [Desulfatirhabdiaceae bacterium]